MELGYMAADEPTEYFGPATQTAVELFQRQHTLQQDGIVGNITYDLLMSKEAKPYVMYEGAEGKDIRAFQEMLYDLGYLERNQITGYYGTNTVAAVQAFQKRNGLAQDGKAGEMTIAEINSSDARPSAEREKEIAEEKKKARKRRPSRALPRALRSLSTWRRTSSASRISWARAARTNTTVPASSTIACARPACTPAG